MRRELPPTSGLPPHIADLYRFSPHALSDLLAASLGTDRVTLTCSGSSALVIAFDYFKRLAVGGEVILPAFSCPLVAHAALKAGLSVRLCDTMPARFDLDLGQLARILSADTLAVVPTHFGAHLTPISPLRAFLRSVAPHIFVIEDAAQAFGARMHGRPVGFSGDVGLFSFAAGKGLTLYEGGCLVAADPVIRMAIERHAQTMLKPNLPTEWHRIAALIGYHAFYYPLGLRWVYGWPLRRHLRRGNLIAALGDDQHAIPMHPLGSWRQSVGAHALLRWNKHLAVTQQRARFLIRLLSQIPQLDLHLPEAGMEPSQTFLFVSFKTKRQADRALRAGVEQGLGVTKLFAHPLNRYPALEGKILSGPTPQAQALSDRTVSVTTSPYMRDQDAERIALMFQTIVRGS